MSQTIKVLDLFCGCGGMTTGLSQTGLQVIAGIDIWDKAIESYQQNHPSHLAVCADLTKLSPQEFAEQYGVKEVDIIINCSPCQGFSIAGTRDANDPRNSLFMEFCKYLDFYKPKMFLMENVMGILSMLCNTGNIINNKEETVHEGENTHEDKKERGKNNEGKNDRTKIIDVIMSYLERDYKCMINKLYASDFEVPQKRRRVIIVGIRKDLAEKHSLKPIQPFSTTQIGVGTILQPRKEIDRKCFLSEKAIQGIQAKKQRSKMEGKGFGAQFLRLDEPSFTIPARYWKDGYDALVKYDEANIRRLTVLELKRIQTFPDNYYLAGSKKEQIIQIGNAVACRFAYHLGLYLLKCFESF